MESEIKSEIKPEIKQLELDFQATVAAAKISPEEYSIIELWESLQEPLTTLSDFEQLRLAGNVIEALAEIHQAKANQMLDEWDQDPNQEPIFSDELLAGIAIRQSQHLDVSSLIRQSTLTKRKQTPQSGESIVGEVPKANVLKMAEQLERQKQEALSLAHNENVSGWQAAISRVLSHTTRPMSVWAIREVTQLSLVEVWLGLLLGGFQLVQEPGDFYHAQIKVLPIEPN